MISCEKGFEIKSQALYDTKPNNDFFLDTILDDQLMKPAILAVIEVLKQTSKYKQGTKVFNFKLGKAMLPFIEESIKKYVHKHIIISNLIITGIEKYWKEKKENIIVMVEDTYETLMKDLDELLFTTIPKIDKSLTKLNYKPKVYKEPQVYEELHEKCYCSNNEIMCFCIKKNGEWFKHS